MKKYLISFLALALMCNIALAASLTADRASEVKPVKVLQSSDFNLSNVAPAAPAKVMQGVAPVPDPNVILQGGDNINSATVISSLPYTDNGTTSGYSNDYLGSCMYSGGGAPDVVYSYAPTSNMSINVETCGSSFDTGIYIFENNASTEIACNDDNCALQSRVLNVALTAGNIYYIVVDGYYTSSGSYVINVTGNVPVEVVCPPNGIPEGEPVCEDEYVDATNGGCNSTPAVFGSIAHGDTICGTSGTFLVGGNNNRDTDWYLFTLTEANDITTTVNAEFQAYLFVIQMGNPDLCTGYNIVNQVIAEPLVPTSIEATLQPGSYVIWVGPTTFSGIPCNSDYYVSLNFSNPPDPPDPCANSVYSNGTVDWVNGLACERVSDNSIDAWVVDDMTLANAIDINELHFWSLTSPTYEFGGTADLIILENDGSGGAPSTVVTELSDLASTRDDLGDPHFGYPAYIYEIAGLNIHLTPGTYFIGMRPVNGASSGQNYWGTAPVTGSQVYFQSAYFGFPNWTLGSGVFGASYDVAFCISGTMTSIDDNTVPTKVNILSNYPNPFNPSTDISFAALKNGDVKLEVFNLTGQKVRTLIDGYMTSGPKSVKWDGKSDNGASVSSGVYYYKLSTEDGVQVKKMTLMK